MRVTKNTHVVVVADDRERGSDVIKSLQEIQQVSVQIKRLPVGDYQVDNRLVFERKTLKDFALSIIDGRIFNQAIRLVSSPHKSVLILEGTAKDIARMRIKREAMQGALISIAVILGIPVLRANDPSETARLIVYATRQIRAIVRGGLRRHGYRPKNKRNRQLYILQGLPGIGREKAARLLNAFGSVAAVMTASSDELQSVEGIGKNIADRIKWTVAENVEHYGIIDDFPI